MSQNSKEQAQAQLSSIVAMVRALHVDYDYLEELKNQFEEIKPDFNEGAEVAEEASNHPDFSAQMYDDLQQLEADANGNESEEEAREAIRNDALDISFRSGWSNSPNEMKAEEFRVLLCTGGPAVQIVGDLNQYNEPENVKLMHQDWFESWEELNMSEEETQAVIEYCQQFYFGE